MEALRLYFGLLWPDLGTGEYDKPCVQGRPYVQFSLTHTGRWAVCAVDVYPVGVDAETVRPHRMAVAKRFYTAEEQRWIEGLPSEKERDRAFTRFWTRKEAYLKYTGRGIGGDWASVAPFGRTDRFIRLSMKGSRAGLPIIVCPTELLSRFVRRTPVCLVPLRFFSRNDPFFEENWHRRYRSEPLFV